MFYSTRLSTAAGGQDTAMRDNSGRGSIPEQANHYSPSVSSQKFIGQRSNSLVFKDATHLIVAFGTDGESDRFIDQKTLRSIARGEKQSNGKKPTSEEQLMAKNVLADWTAGRHFDPNEKTLSYETTNRAEMHALVGYGTTLSRYMSKNQDKLRVMGVVDENGKLTEDGFNILAENKAGLFPPEVAEAAAYFRDNPIVNISAGMDAKEIWDTVAQLSELTGNGVVGLDNQTVKDYV